MYFAVLHFVGLSLAASPQYAIVDVDAPDLMMGMGALITRAVENEAKNQKLTVMTAEQLRSKLPQARYDSLKKCAGKPACVAQELSPLGVKRAVLGELRRDEKNYLLKMWLIDVDAMSIIADVERSILIAARRFHKDLEQAIPPLLRGEREARGTLVLNANLPDAQISVNGEFVGAPPVTMTLKPGKYEVKIERKKYLSITRLIGVEANQRTETDFKLLLKPGEIPDGQAAALVATKAGDSQSGPQLSPLSFILGGSAIAAGGVGLGFGLLARSQLNALQMGFDPTAMTYQSTRAEALEQNRNAIIANAAFIVGGLALAGTVVSIIIDSSRVQVAPTLQNNGAGVSVGGTF